MQGEIATMRIAALAAAVLGAIGCLAGSARAQSQGPFCFSTQPFDDVLSLNILANGPNQFLASGTDLATGSNVSATITLAGSLATVSFVVPASPNAHTSIGSAAVNVATGSGPGVCEAVNTLSGCGVGTNITMAVVGCSSAQALTQGTPSRNLMGGER
jgi:hypothetical protein